MWVSTATRQALKDENGDVRIADALTEVVDDTSPKRDVLDRFKAAGRYLFGTNESYMRDKANEPYDALLYVQAEDLLESGAFSVVRMATWVRRSVGVTSGYNDRSLVETLTRASFTDVTDKDEGAMIWGVPVERMTVIGGFDNDEAYVYGHAKELEVVTNLEVTDRLKGLLATVTQAWHSSEVRRGGDASFADIQDALQDHWI